MDKQELVRGRCVGADQATSGGSPGSRAGPAWPAASPARPSAVQAVPQAGDLVGQLGLARPGALDHRGRRARHERLVRESLAGRSQPALGLGQLAVQPFAFQVGRVGIGRLRPDGRLDLAAGRR